MIQTHPYFMEKEEWYNYDAEAGTFTLTDKATPKARKSFEEWINQEPYDPIFFGLNDEEFMQAVKAQKEWLNDDSNYDRVRNNRHYRKREWLKEKRAKEEAKRNQMLADATENETSDK